MGLGRLILEKNQSRSPWRKTAQMCWMQQIIQLSCRTEPTAVKVSGSMCIALCIVHCATFSPRFYWFRSKTKVAPPCFPSAWTFAKHCPLDSVQPGPGLQLLCCLWSKLHLLLGHQEQGGKPSDQEESKPLHPQEKCQAERGLSQAEAKPFISEFYWRSGSCLQCAQLWPVWLQSSLWEGAGAAQEDEAQTIPAGTHCSSFVMVNYKRFHIKHHIVFVKICPPTSQITFLAV